MQVNLLILAIRSVHEVLVVKLREANNTAISGEAAQNAIVANVKFAKRITGHGLNRHACVEVDLVMDCNLTARSNSIGCGLGRSQLILTARSNISTYRRYGQRGSGKGPCRSSERDVVEGEEARKHLKGEESDAMHVVGQQRCWCRDAVSNMKACEV